MTKVITLSRRLTVSSSVVGVAAVSQAAGRTAIKSGPNELDKHHRREPTGVTLTVRARRWQVRLKGLK